MRRIAIIDHANHRLIVDDVDEKLLEEKYYGEEEEYIKDNYTFEGEWSWDYIIDGTYFTPYSNEPVELDFENF